MQNIASKLSGATLGYIIGNLPGARLGYKMAPYKNSYKRKASQYPQSKGKYVKRRRYGKKLARSSNNAVTTQFDMKTQYVKKRMPKFKKRTWKKFSKKVMAVQIKNAGLKTVLFNDRLVNATTPGYQNHLWLGLYGISGTDDNATNLIGWRDVRRIFENDPDVFKSGTPPNQDAVGGKLTFASAVLDVTIRNLGEIDAEVDVYFCTFRKDQDQGSPAFDNPANFFGNQPLLVNTGNTAVSLVERGATIFDCSASISNTGVQVIRKQKFLLTGGKTIFLQHRDPRNYQIDAMNIIRTGFAKKAVTYGVCIVHKPSVSNSEDLVSTLAVGVTRKYSYTALEENADCASKL